MLWIRRSGKACIAKAGKWTGLMAELKTILADLVKLYDEAVAAVEGV